MPVKREGNTKVSWISIQESTYILTVEKQIGILYNCVILSILGTVIQEEMTADRKLIST